MIREARSSDIPEIMELWLSANLQAHSFVPDHYWTDHYDTVKKLLPQAELYVWEAEDSGKILGFIGLDGTYIAGIFILDGARSQGIGAGLIRHVKSLKDHLSLKVYEKNQRAVAFYKREGFQIQSESLDSDTGEREYCMVWGGQAPA